MARLNLRDERDYSKNITFRVEWIKEQYKRIREVYSKEEISDKDLQNLLISEFNENKQLVNGRFYSNITNRNEIMDQEQFSNIYLNRPYSMSGYGALFEDPDISDRIIVKALEFLGDQRAINRKASAKEEFGSKSYKKFETGQLTFKLLGNSYYGITGEKNSIFYNPLIQNSITMTGQDLTTNAIAFIERFMGGNSPHRNFDSILSLIVDMSSKEYKYNILEFIDEAPSVETILKDFNKNSRKQISEENLKTLEKVLLNKTDEQRAIIYYSSKFDKFIENSKVRGLLSKILEFKYGETVDERVKDDLELLKDLIMEFVYYDSVIEDRYYRTLKDPRYVAVASDTDSVFTNFGGKVKHFQNLLNMDTEDKDSTISLINILIYLTSTAIKEYMDLVMVNFGVKEKYRPIINLDPEYLYRRMLFTNAKKNYAGIMLSKVGREFPEPKLDIKGLAIKKSTVSKEIRNEFSDILFQDILKDKDISIKKILERFNSLSKRIEESLKKREMVYTIPKSISTLDNYKDPETQEHIRGFIVWNTAYPDEPITAPDRVNVIKMKALPIGHDAWVTLKKKNPQVYYRILKATQGGKTEVVMENVYEEYKKVYGEDSFTELRAELAKIDEIPFDISRFGFNVIAVPQTKEIYPEELKDFIDYDAMITTGLRNGYVLLESVGVRVYETRGTPQRSNIVEI